MRSETIQLLTTIFIGILIGVINYRNSKRPYRLLLFLLIATFAAEAVAEYCAHKYRNNLFVYHFFHPVEYTLLALVFYHLISNKVLKKILLITVCIYTPLSVWNSLYIERFADNKINATAILAESILLVLFSLQVLFEFLRQPLYENVFAKSSFWLSIGVLLFFATNVFFWGYYSRLEGNDKGVRLFYKILFYENIVLYLLFAVSLFLVRSQKEEVVGLKQI